MTTPHRTLQMALDALDAITDDVDGTGLNTMPSFDKAIDAIAALREALAQPAPERWMPIETAPKDVTILLYGAKRLEMCVGMHHSRDGWVTDTTSEWMSMYPPTHWMPLPAAPDHLRDTTEKAAPAEDFCYCDDDISLQMVSGGAALEGLYGRVTLKINGQYVDYVKAQPAPAEPVALESVHLTRDINGMCTVRVNGRVAIQDNGDIIDHMATLEWFAQPALCR